MSNSDRNKFPFHWFWIGLGLFMSVGGVSSIVDDFKRWFGVFAAFVHLYKTWIREPLSHVVHFVLPHTWLPLPTWTIDALIIWFAVNLALQAAYLRIHRTPFILFHLKERIDDYRTAKGSDRIVLVIITPLMVIVDAAVIVTAPVLLPAIALVDYIQTKDDYGWRLLKFYFLFLASLCGIVLVLMNLNLQFK